MVRLNNTQFAKEKRVRFSASVDRNVEHKYTSHNSSNQGKSPYKEKLSSNVGKSASAVDKKLVRNVEQSGISCHVYMEQKEAAENKFLRAKCGLGIETETTYKSKYGAPELYSSLCIAKAIQITANAGRGNNPDYEHMRPDARKAIQDKSLLKLNIPFEHKLYKDLVPVKVDDDELLCKHSARREVTFPHCKDLEPQLSDFCRPAGGLEFCTWTKPVCDFGKSVQHYNGYCLYKSCHTWES